MIQIIKPGSSQIRIGTDDAILEWSSEESGQTAYEIMYKLKTETVWNTCGKVTSSNSSYDLTNLYDIAATLYTNIDLVEISYKVKGYYDSISDESNIYTLIFSGSPVNYINIYNNGSTSQYPLFESINNSSLDTIKVSVNDKVLLTPLVENDSALASRVLVRVTPTNTRSLVNSYVDISGDITYNNFQRYAYGEGTYLVPFYSQYSYLAKSTAYSYISSTEKYSYQRYYTYYSYNTTGYNKYQTYYNYYTYYTYNTYTRYSYVSGYSYYYYSASATYGYVTGYSTYSYTVSTSASGPTYGYKYQTVYSTNNGSYNTYSTGSYTYSYYVTPYITAYHRFSIPMYNPNTRKSYYTYGTNPIYAGGTQSGTKQYTYRSGTAYYRYTTGAITSIQYVTGSYTYYTYATAYGSKPSTYGYGYYYTTTSTSRPSTYRYSYYTTSTTGSRLTYAPNGYAYSTYAYTAYNTSGLSRANGYAYAYLNVYNYNYLNTYAYGYLDNSYYNRYYYKYLVQ